MQSEKRIFDDISKIITGVAGTVSGMGREAQEAFRERSREWAAGLDLVSREEFDAVKELAANARSEADALAKRVAVLEAALGKSVKSAPTTKVASTKAAAVKPAKAVPGKKPTAAKK
jgi:BMFP domain-containing protein YqiC